LPAKLHQKHFFTLSIKILSKPYYIMAQMHKKEEKDSVIEGKFILVAWPNRSLGWTNALEALGGLSY